MSISGNLQTMGMPELLGWLSEGRKTGTLVVDNSDVRKEIFFESGKIISSSSTDPQEYLGQFLVSHGFITDGELAKAVEMQESNKMLLGKILLTIGLISEDDLDHMLRLKSQESIYELFSWPQGDFHFVEGDLPENTMVPIALDVTSLIFIGMQRLDEWNLIRAHIRSGNAVPIGLGELASGEEEPRSAKILAQVDDRASVIDIARRAHTSEFHVSRVLLPLVEAGRVKMIEPTAAPEVALDGSTEIPATALIARAERLATHDRFEAAMQHAAAARALEPENDEVENRAAAVHEALTAKVEEVGLTEDAVPTLSDNAAEIRSLDMSPQEAFLLSRVDGSCDIATIAKISPLSTLQAQVLFWRLLRAGYIEVGRPKKAKK